MVKQQFTSGGGGPKQSRPQCLSGGIAHKKTKKSYAMNFIAIYAYDKKTPHIFGSSYSAKQCTPFQMLASPLKQDFIGRALNPISPHLRYCRICRTYGAETAQRYRSGASTSHRCGPMSDAKYVTAMFGDQSR